MSFDAERFRQAQFSARTAVVRVEGLAAFFGDDPPDWTVRGLTASELQRCFDAGKRQGTVEAIVKAVATQADQVAAIRKALGLSGDVPGEIAKRLEMLTAGSVAPAIELADAVKLAEAFPIEFMQLTNKITELTGLGADMGKPAAASPKTPTS